MQGANDPFVHVFLFQCGDCGAPIATASANGERNLGQMDAQSFSLECNRCGWPGRSIGTAAKRHWVDLWGLEDGNSGSAGGMNRTEESSGTGKAV